MTQRASRQSTWRAPLVAEPTDGIDAYLEGRRPQAQPSTRPWTPAMREAFARAMREGR